MITAAEIDFSETRRLATQMIVQGERIISLLELQRPLPGIASVTDSPEKMKLIRRVVAARFGLSMEQLNEMNREAARVWPRMVAMYLCRKLTNCSDLAIEREFKRTHGCLDNAIKTINERISVDDVDGRRSKADVKELFHMIKEALK